MFSKAKVKRFNEEVGCAPPPTAYNPKSLSKPNAVSIDKSDRWKDSKENTPAPNAYNAGLPPPPRTPGRALPLQRPKPLRPHNRSDSTGLLNSSVTSNTSNASTSSAVKDGAFISPLAPRLARSGSCRSVRNNTEKYVAQLQQLHQERDALQQTVLELEQKLSSLQCHLADGVAGRLEKEVQTDQDLLCSLHSLCSVAEVSRTIFPTTPQEEADSPDFNIDTIQQSPATTAAADTTTASPGDTTDRPSAICGDIAEAEGGTKLMPEDSSSVRSSEEDLELLREQIAHLTQLRDNLECSVARKDQLISQLQQECSLMEEEGRLHDHLVDTCQQQLMELETRLSESLLEASDSPDESLAGGVEGLVGRVAGLVTRYEALLRDHGDHTAHCSVQLQTLNSTVASLNAKVSSYELEVSSLRAEAGERTAKLSALEETISELSISSKEKEMMEVMMQEEIRQRNQELSLLGEGYTSLEQKVAEAEQRAAAVAAERQLRVDAERRLEELSVAVREAEVLQHFLQKEVLSREEEITSEKTRVQSLSEELSAARKAALDLQGEAEAQLNQVLVLKAALATKDYDIDERDENIITLKEEIESKQELVTDLQDMLSSQKAAKTQLAQELEQKKAEVSELEEKVSEATCEVQRRAELLEQVQREHEVALVCLKDMHHAELERVREEREAEHLEQVQREHEVALACLKDMHHAELEGVREEREAMAARVATLEEECEAGERDLEQLKEKLAETRATVTTLEAKVVELMAELEDCEIAHEKRVEEVRGELEELSAQYSESLLEAEATKRALSHSAVQQQQLQAATEADLRQVREELSGVQSSLSAKSEEYSTLEYSLRQLSDKFTSLEKAKAAEDAEQHELCRRLRAELQLSQQDGEALRTDMKMVASSNEGFKTQILQLRQDLTKKAEALEECKQCVEQLRDERNLATTCTQQLQLELEDRDDQLQDLQQQLQEAHSSLEKSQESLISTEARLERETQALRREVEEARAEHECALEEAVGRERELRQLEIGQLQRRVDQLEQQLQDVADLKDDFAHKVITLENAIEKQTAERERMKEEHKLLLTVQEQHSLLEEELKASVTALEERRAELTLCQSELQQRDGHLAQLEEQLAHRTTALQDKEQELSAATSSVGELEERTSKLQEELRTCQEERQRALSDLERLSEERRSWGEKEAAALRAQFEAALSEARQQRREAEAEADTWKEQCAILEKLVEPFREQLESYEAERARLLCTQSAAQKEVTELSQKYVSLLGHHNHKQKIHHVAKLKTENNRLIEEVAKLRVESDRYRKTVRRLEERLEARSTDLARRKTLAGAASLPEAEGKENIGGSSRSPLRPSNKFNRL